MRERTLYFGQYITADRTKLGAWAALAAVVLAVLLALPALKYGALDLIGGSAHSYDAPGDTFPGSAFFYAEGAFDPVPGVPTNPSAHVLTLSSGSPAAAARFQGRTALDHMWTTPTYKNPEQIF